MGQYSIHKSERLRSKKLIARLFEKGKSEFAHPIKILYLPESEPDIAGLVQFGVSVPKRLHRKATTRNLLKRRMREAHRTNKNDLHQAVHNIGGSLAILYIYVKAEIEEYKSIEKSVKRLHRRLIQKIEKSHFE